LSKGNPSTQNNQRKIPKFPHFSQIEKSKQDLQISEFFQNSIKICRKSLEKQDRIIEIICLGLGRFSDCVISRYQLAFILLLKEEFRIEKFRVFDPVFSGQEKELLSYLDCEVLEENLEGKYLAERPTLFYFPHCPKQLSNNLLWKNWSPNRLKSLILISNSFRNILDSTPERLLRPNAHYLLEISPYVTEESLANSFKFNDIFNDTSIHSFQAEKLASINAEFWSKNQEPTYEKEDLEFVKNDVAIGIKSPP
jgi:hypothetical protein